MGPCFYWTTPYLSRAWLLGIGNTVRGLGTFLTGAANSFGTFLGARGVAAAGGSAQHPVGYNLLAGYFPKARGTILALNSSISNVGGLIAPRAAGGLLLIMGWRQIFFIVAFISVAMGIVYFFTAGRLVPPKSGGSLAVRNCCKAKLAISRFSATGI